MAWHVDAAALERYAESHACARAASYASRPSLLYYRNMQWRRLRNAQRHVMLTCIKNFEFSQKCDVVYIRLAMASSQE